MGVADVALLREQQHRVVLVGRKEEAVHVPEPIQGGVRTVGDDDEDCRRGITRVNGVGRDGETEGVVGTAWQSGGGMELVMALS